MRSYFLLHKVHPPELVVFDITDASSLHRKVESVVAIHGGLDVLINNAGISYRGEIEHTNIDVYRKLMEVNFFGQIALTKGNCKQKCSCSLL